MKSIINLINENSNIIRKGNIVTGKAPNGTEITGKFIEYYGNKYAIIKKDDKEYAVLDHTLVKVPKTGNQKDASTNKKQQEYQKLLKRRKDIETEMEEVLGAIGDDKYDGNNIYVAKYGKMLDAIDRKIEKLFSD